MSELPIYKILESFESLNDGDKIIFLKQYTHAQDAKIKQLKAAIDKVTLKNEQIMGVLLNAR